MCVYYVFCSKKVSLLWKAVNIEESEESRVRNSVCSSPSFRSYRYIARPIYLFFHSQLPLLKNSFKQFLNI